MDLLQVGKIRLGVLDINGALTKTLILPAPGKDGIELDWEEVATTVSLVDGGRRTRRIGYLPVLLVRWPVYDDEARPGVTIGTGDGQRPSLPDLLGILSATTGRLKISPGMSAGWVLCDQVTTKQIGKRANYYTGLQATFYGRDPRTTKSLEIA